jgi:hypothetical protein
VERVFYLAEKVASEGSPNFGGFDSIFGCLLNGYYTVYYFMSPPNSAQHYDFTGLTPNDYMDMDLSPIFGLNSRFGAIWGGIWRFSALASLTLAENLGLSKSNWRLRLLGPS